MIDKLGYASWSRRTLSEKLRMKSVVGNLVPRLLTQDEKQSRLNSYCELTAKLLVDWNDFSKVITGSEMVLRNLQTWKG